MCGRYYVDDETSQEIEKIVQKLDQSMDRTSTRLNLQSFLQRSVGKWLQGRCSGAFRGSKERDCLSMQGQRRY